mgnify:CR=1 FL=1
MLLIAVIVAVAVLVLVFLYRPGGGGGGGGVQRGAKAVIVDSLGSGFVNPDSLYEMIECLYKAGFSVDVRVGSESEYPPPISKIKKYVRELRTRVEEAGIGDKVSVELTEITVDFYKELFKSGYHVIVLRVHSTYTPDLSAQGWTLPEGSVVIITQEKYEKTRHFVEQLGEQLMPSFAMNVSGIPLGYGFFAFTERFVRAQSAVFPNSTIIVLGCHGLYTRGLAQAFLDRGALAYFGFDGFVDAFYSDKVGAKLLEKLFLEKESVGDAVVEVLLEVGPDPYYGSRLEFVLRKGIDPDIKPAVLYLPRAHE